MKKIIPISLIILALAGCSSTPKEEQLLPDSGPTTSEIINRKSTTQRQYGSNGVSRFQGESVATGYNPSSSYSHEHVQELRRDFQQVPNPEIVGYIYSHIKDNRIPVTGHYTVFRLYNADHYALSSEGRHGQ